MNLVCKKPFKTIEVHTGGDISLCCYSWLPHFCGNVLESDITEILSNVTRVEILENMRQGKFSHCNDRCPHLTNYNVTGNIPDRFADTQILETELATTPWEIHLTYDQSCNLVCPSCRNELILTKLNANKNLQAIHEKTIDLINAILSTGDTVILHITGSGDPFASPLFWNYLRESAVNPKYNLYFELITNGTLMTETRLEQLASLTHKIKIINVSIDAATPETYSKVRKNGNFDKLVENLTYLDSTGIRWMSNYTVQNDNIEDLKSFVEWQLTYKNLRSISLSGVSRWGHMSDIQYERMAVWKLDHINNSRLKEILSDRIFLDKRVKLGNLSGLLK